MGHFKKSSCLLSHKAIDFLNLFVKQIYTVTSIQNNQLNANYIMAELIPFY